MGTWSPITGIPEPSWGITQEAVALSGLNYNYVGDGGLQSYRIGANGPYTHLIDVTHPSGTNSSNPYGTEDYPRTAWPADIRTLASGSIVEIRGSGNFGGERFESDGTADLPIYFRAFPGYDGQKPTIWRTWFPQGSYYIFENLYWDFQDNEISRTAFGIADYDTSASVDYIAIRNCEITGIDYNGSAGSNQAIVMNHRHTSDGTPSGIPDGTIQNIVIDNCYIHHNGHQNSGDYDVSGIFIGCNSSGIWITNNDFWMMGGDGIQLNADNNEAPNIIGSPNTVYIGQNTAHDMYENLLDLKMCYDVVVSRNVAYDIGEGFGVIGKVGRGGAPYRYGLADVTTSGEYRHNIWTIFNEAYNCRAEDGAFLSFNSESNGEEFADEIYYLGNIVHDCTLSGTVGKTSTGFGFWNQREIHVCNNTVYNMDVSIKANGERDAYPQADEKMYIIGNIFSEVQPSSYYPQNMFLYGNETSLGRAVVNNNLYYKTTGGDQFKEYINPGTTSANYDPAVDYTYTEFLSHRAAWLTDSINANPLMTDPANNDYTLQANSPAIGAGYDHGLYDLFESTWGMSIKEDFYGNVIDTNNLDIGAYYSGNGTSTTPNLVLGVDNLHLVLHSI